jgi:hypothetical protein
LKVTLVKYDTEGDYENDDELSVDAVKNDTIEKLLALLEAQAEITLRESLLEGEGGGERVNERPGGV